MAPNDELTKLLDSIGAISEMLKAMYDDLIKIGFTETQAMYLTGEFLRATIQK